MTKHQHGIAKSCTITASANFSSSKRASRSTAEEAMATVPASVTLTA
jgi:hypothetical protein